MDEMNNVTMENETSMMENAPVENLVPAEAEGYTSDCGCESNEELYLEVLKAMKEYSGEDDGEGEEYEC